jgi:hypothetical protein
LLISKGIYFMYLLEAGSRTKQVLHNYIEDDL